VRPDEKISVHVDGRTAKGVVRSQMENSKSEARK